MEALITVLHVLTCLALIAIVLLQHGKGADIGVAFGGGSSQTVFGARGAGNFLTKLTTGAAIVFMVTSFALSRLSDDGGIDALVGDLPASEPMTEPAPAPSTFPDARPIEDDEAPTGIEEGSAAPAGDAPPAEEAPAAP